MIRNFLNELHDAEFGGVETEPNPAKELKLLQRALRWKSHKHLEKVCVFLGAEDDDRIDTVEGCKEIIQEDVDCLYEELR